MDCKGLEGDGLRVRSFRYEDYNTRRAFLRSYPLDWGEDEGKNEDTERINKESTGKGPAKKIFLSVFHWSGEKTVILRRFKHKLTVYVIACIPVRFK